jgi:hypothetical protein
MDFLTPPPESELEALRESMAARMSSFGANRDAISVPVEAAPSAVEVPPMKAVEPDPPAFDFGDLNAPPALDAYLDQAPLGAKHLMELAAGLEKNGHFKRALLAWERVLDHGVPDAAQADAAVAAIQRLKPTLPPWNADVEAAISITLRAGTGVALADELEPELERIATDIETASGGLLRVTSMVAKGAGAPPAGRPSPVAVWLAGPEGNEPSTSVVSFTASPGDPLRQTVLKLVEQLVASELRLKSGWSIAAAPSEGGEVTSATMSRITRLGWKTVAAGLQPPAAVE